MTTIPTIDFPVHKDFGDEHRLHGEGFRWSSTGIHTSRTIMLSELTTLLAHCNPDVSHSEYMFAIRDDNCLGKKTATTRKKTASRLSNIYALDDKVLLFQVFRNLWYSMEDGRRLLAMLLALARDPLLRATLKPILKMQQNEELVRHELELAVREAAGDRLGGGTMAKVVRNTASSWTQSSHLYGRTKKLRQRVAPSASVVTYALFLGFLCGFRGQALFDTLWAETLDSTPSALLEKAVDARRLGFLNLAYAGNVMQVEFTPLLNAAIDKRGNYGAN